MDSNFTNDSTGNVHHLYSDRHPRDVGGYENIRYTFDRITSDISMLWDKERLLIRTEINEKIMEIKAASVRLGVGLGLCFAGLIATVFAFVYVLDVFLPIWAASVITMALLFVIGGALVLSATKRLGADRLTPRHSLETLGHLKTNLKERVHEFKH